MKRYILISFLIVFGYQISQGQNSEAQRMVLIEHFTQASCGYCPSWNAAYNALIAANPGKVQILRYQVSWPGYDPMNQHNPGEVATRVTFYGVSGVPSSRLDGANVGQVNQSSLDARYAVPSPFTINLTHRLSTNYDSIYVTMVITATENILAGLRAQIAVIEKHIHFAYPPGSNGETDFYNVMKKMIPNANGTTMPAMTTGQTFTVTGGWKLKNVYDIDELAVIGFIQDIGNRDVKQASYSDAVPVIPLYTYDANLRILISEHDCSGNAKPTITFANFGSAPLTSLTVKYQVNGGTLSTYLWNTTTPLNFLEYTSVELPQISFTGTNNQLKVYLTNPNGNTDQNPANDTLRFNFDNVRNCYTKLYLKMKLDGNAAGITWKMLKPDGSTLMQGGPYNNNQPISVTISAPEEGCYKFFMMDSDGDGLAAPGYYKLYDSVGNVFADSVRFTGYQVVHALNVRKDAGILEKIQNKDFQVIPNPFINEATLYYNIDKASTVSISLYNVLGEMVYSHHCGKLSPGIQKFILDAANFDQGIYFIKLNINNQQLIKKVMITK